MTIWFRKTQGTGGSRRLEEKVKKDWFHFREIWKTRPSSREKKGRRLVAKALGGKAELFLSPGRLIRGRSVVRNLSAGILSIRTNRENKWKKSKGTCPPNGDMPPKLTILIRPLQGTCSRTQNS